MFPFKLVRIPSREVITKIRSGFEMVSNAERRSFSIALRYGGEATIRNRALRVVEKRCFRECGCSGSGPGTLLRVSHHNETALPATSRDDRATESGWPLVKVAE